MNHNPDLVPTGVRVWDHFKDLKRRPEFYEIDDLDWQQDNESATIFIPDEDDVDKVMRMVIYMCSRESPHYLELDYSLRVKQCMRSAGIQKNSVLAAMINEAHWWYRRLLMLYIKTFSTVLFANWVSSKAMVFNMLEVMMSKPRAGDSDIKGFVKASSDASKQIDDLNVRIDALERQLFPVDELAQMVTMQHVFDDVNTAESYARTFTNEIKFNG